MLKTADKLPQQHSTEWNGMPLIIEWPTGSTRVRYREDGTPFKTEMKCDYGYIPRTEAAGDEDNLDVYIGPNEDAEFAYAIEQLNDAGDFDEYKIMLGLDSLEEAEAMYLANQEDNQEDHVGDIEEIPLKYLFDIVEKHQEEKTAAKGIKPSTLKPGGKRMHLREIEMDGWWDWWVCPCGNKFMNEYGTSGDADAGFTEVDEFGNPTGASNVLFHFYKMNAVGIRCDGCGTTYELFTHDGKYLHEIEPEQQTGFEFNASFDKVALNIPRLVQDFGPKLVARYHQDRGFPQGTETNPEHIITAITKYDPTPNKEYTAWVVGNYTRGDIGVWDDIRTKVGPALERFNELKKLKLLNPEDRDIGKVKGLIGLNGIVDKYSEILAISNRRKRAEMEKRYFASGDAVLFYNDDELKIVIPKTADTAKFFGINTKWCTAAREDSGNFFTQVQQ